MILRNYHLLLFTPPPLQVTTLSIASSAFVDQCYAAGRNQHFSCPCLIQYPMPGGLPLGSSRNQVVIEWATAIALGRQGMWAIWYLHHVTKSMTHNYKPSPFIKKTIYHHGNSQTNSNTMQYLVVSENCWPRNSISFLLNRLFPQSLTVDSPGRQRARGNHAT